jgi:hypothetical protein
MRVPKQSLQYNMRTGPSSPRRRKGAVAPLRVRLQFEPDARSSVPGKRIRGLESISATLSQDTIISVPQVD